MAEGGAAGGALAALGAFARGAHHSFECAKQNVTYEHRVDNPAEFNWCPVPFGGADALLFVGIAILSAAVLYHKLSAVWTLLAGAAFAALSSAFNLGHFSNALTIWLGIQPAPLFFFLFLPPLLLDSATRIDFFLFKRIAVVCLVFAFFNVIAATFALVPLLQHGLGLAKEGWRPMDCALFASMLAATDAVAVAAILKGGGAPEVLAVILEGESLFNDASSIIFLKLSSRREAEGHARLGELLGVMVLEIGQLAGVGVAMGLLVGYATKMLFKLMQRRAAQPHVEVAITLGGAYLSYLLTEYYGLFGLHGSGVIGVVVYGLFGSSTLIFGLSAKGRRNNTFFAFWDVTQFIANGLVFFFVGASVVNFFVRIAPELSGVPDTDWHALAAFGAKLLVKRVLPVSAVTLLLRGTLMLLEAPLLGLVGPQLSWQEVVFGAVGGLRGGLALILAQTVLTSHHEDRVRASMVLWTAGIVLVSLVVNGPLLVPLMTALRLNKSTPAKRHMHKRARAAVDAYTRQALLDLQRDDDEMLRGVDWLQARPGLPRARAARAAASLGRGPCRLECSTLVQAEVDMTQEVEEVFRTTEAPNSSSGISSDDSGSDGDGSEYEHETDGGGGSGAIGAGGASRGGTGDLESQASSAARPSPASSLRRPLLVNLARAASGGRPRHGRSGGGRRRSCEPGGGAEGEAAAQRWARTAGGSAPPEPPLPTGEELFIANRCSAQDQALAQQHAAGAVDCPFVPGAPPARGGGGGGDQDVEGEEEGGEGGGLRPAASEQSLGGASVGGSMADLAAAAAAADAGGGGGSAPAGGSPRAAAAAAAEPRLLPLVVVCREGPAPARSSSKPGLSPFARAARGDPRFAPPPAPGYHHTPHDGPAPAAAVPEELPGAFPPAAAAGRGAALAQQSFIWREMTKGGPTHMSAEEEEEAAEGLLSTQGLRLLDYACDACMAYPERSVDLWSHVEREVVSHGATPYLAQLHFRLRQVQAAAIRGGRKGNLALSVVQAPLSWVSRKMRNRLSSAAMAALEVALELWLALTASPQARWINYCTTHASALLQEELRHQSAVVWHFIVDREVEAPDEFSACQTHRATLAVLRRQLAFVEQMGQLGAVEEEEQEALGALLEEKLAHLERRGPRWRAPPIAEVMRRVPFLEGATEETLLWVRAYGEMRSFNPGQIILPPSSPGIPGVFIVLSGLVRVVVARGAAYETNYVVRARGWECVGGLGPLMGRHSGRGAVEC
ncbi:MAG: Sodium/hydrogen exchanger family-domain-containing protein [Monoraphidium minutum]|nr:MAG: Sodium/hydrogen exchanger family-domain-containing protein [Monoraphidium minutum]